jgi:hypothetical protein
MAYAVLHAVASRLERDGRLQGPLPSAFMPPGAADPIPTSPTSADAPVERPPLSELRAAA